MQQLYQSEQFTMSVQLIHTHICVHIWISMVPPYEPSYKIDTEGYPAEPLYTPSIVLYSRVHAAVNLSMPWNGSMNNIMPYFTNTVPYVTSSIAPLAQWPYDVLEHFTVISTLNYSTSSTNNNVARCSRGLFYIPACTQITPFIIWGERKMWRQCCASFHIHYASCQLRATIPFEESLWPCYNTHLLCRQYFLTVEHMHYYIYTWLLSNFDMILHEHCFKLTNDNLFWDLRHNLHYLQIYKYQSLSQTINVSKFAWPQFLTGNLFVTTTLPSYSTVQSSTCSAVRVRRALRIYQQLLQLYLSYLSHRHQPYPHYQPYVCVNISTTIQQYLDFFQYRSLKRYSSYPSVSSRLSILVFHNYCVKYNHA